jgi:hypothetical protein
MRVEVPDHGVRALAFGLRGVAVGQWAAVGHLPKIKFLLKHYITLKRLI